MSDPDSEDKRSKALANFAGKLEKQKEEDKEAKKKILKEGIEEREKSSKGSIMSSKAVTGTLSNMRGKAGMSAFVGTSGKIKSPRLRRGEFIEMLARELLLIGNDEFKDSGGVVTMNKLKTHFDESRDNWELRENDIEEAVKYLSKENMIPNFEKLDKDMEIIYFKPIELSQDIKKILMAAHGIEATKTGLTEILGWNKERVDAAVKQLVSIGIAVEQEDFVFFPGM